MTAAWQISVHLRAPNPVKVVSSQAQNAENVSENNSGIITNAKGQG